LLIEDTIVLIVSLREVSLCISATNLQQEKEVSAQEAEQGEVPLFNMQTKGSHLAHDCGKILFGVVNPMVIHCERQVGFFTAM
jgi:hypothetical protein